MNTVRTEDRKVFIVSYPRSGQNYTQRLLLRVTGVNDYCELYNCRDKKCPGANLKREMRIPCPAGKRFQKNHDFDLKMDRHEHCLYLVLFRKPLYSLMSYFEFDLKRLDKLDSTGPQNTQTWLEDSPEGWRKFAERKAHYWRGFILKWAAMPRTDNVKLIKYERITQDLEAAQDLFDFAFSGFDGGKLSEIMLEQKKSLAEGHAPKRNISDFRFEIDDRLLDSIRNIIGTEALALVGYDDIV